MNDVMNSTRSIDISHLIRNRLTSIALGVGSLQQILTPQLSVEQKREFDIIHSSIADIKSVLDQMASTYYMELFALNQQRCQSESLGATKPPRIDTVSDLANRATGLSTGHPDIIYK